MKKMQLFTLGAVVLATSVLGTSAQAADVEPAPADATHAPATPGAAMKPEAEAPAAPVDPAAVVLRVNGASLTQGELDQLVGRQMAPHMSQMAQSGQSLGPDQIENIRKLTEAQVIEMWTSQQIITDAVKGYDIEIPAEKVDSTIEELRGRAASQGFKLEDALTSQGMTIDSLKTEIGTQLKMEAGIEKLVEEKTGPIDPSPEDLQELRTSHILIGFGGDPRDLSNKPTEEEKAEKKKKAEELLAEIKGGADFAELAKKNSTCPSAPKGGDLDYNPKGMMVPAYDEAAWKLKDGEVSDVVETQFGYHIIKATGRRTNDSPEAKEQLRRKTVGERFPKVMEELHNKAKIEDLRPESDKAPMMGMPMMAPPSDEATEAPAEK